MSRTVLSKVEGFTPVIDSVVKDTGSFVTALVFGRMWRFCQMKDGVCNATLETIADGLGMSRTTVMVHAKKLVDAGYLEDRSPGLKNHPHTYIDTGKASLQVGVSAGVDVNLADVKNDDVNLIDTDVNVVDTSVNLKHMKIVLKKEEDISKNENLKKDIASKGGLDWSVLGGVSSEEIARLTELENNIKEKCDAYEQAMGYNPLPWGSKEFEPLAKFLAKQSIDDIKRFAEWSKNPYNGLSPAKARLHPRMVIDLWPQAIQKESPSTGHLL